MDVFTRNTVTGLTGYVPEHFLSDDLFGAVLEVVPEGTKPLAYTPLEVEKSPAKTETKITDKVLENYVEDHKKDVK